VGLAVANQHGAIPEANDGGVGDSDFEDVGGEIFQSRLTGGDRLGVDVPVDLPELEWDLIEQFVLPHEITEFGTEDFGERLDGEKEIDFGGMPRAPSRAPALAQIKGRESYRAHLLALAVVMEPF
jgi:hypothetical protein